MLKRNLPDMPSALIAGSGGQGVLFLGKLLAHGAMLAKKNVTWFPSYGAEMRGGTANCTVIISNEVIGSPIVQNPDITVVLNEASRERFEPRLKIGGLMVLDSSMVTSTVSREDIRIVKVPATDIAARMGAPKVANMVIMGALLGQNGLLDMDSALRALEEMTPKHRAASLEPNKKAIQEGKAYLDRS
jgi:2-oxoglutarate ferredoxin oxidoreductase subunit gamma